MAKPFANSGDPDQTQRSAASDLGLHCLPIALLGVTKIHWDNKITIYTQSTAFYLQKRLYMMQNVRKEPLCHI